MSTSSFYFCWFLSYISYKGENQGYIISSFAKNRFLIAMIYRCFQFLNSIIINPTPSKQWPKPMARTMSGFLKTLCFYVCTILQLMERVKDLLCGWVSGIVIDCAHTISYIFYFIIVFVLNVHFFFSLKTFMVSLGRHMPNS